MTPLSAQSVKAANEVASKVVGGIAFSHSWFPYDALVNAIAAALEEETEACAKVADEIVIEAQKYMAAHWGNKEGERLANLEAHTASKIVAAIRQRKGAR